MVKQKKMWVSKTSVFFAAIHNSVTAGCDVPTAQANAAAAVSATDPAVPQASGSARQVNEAIFAPEFMRQAADE